MGLGKKGYIKPFDLVIHKGEVVGFTGLLGSGRSETVRVLYGAEKPDEGELSVKGRPIAARHPLTSMNAGMAYLPEDRKNEGIISDLSVRENLIMALQAKRGMFHLLSRKQQEEFTDKYIDCLLYTSRGRFWRHTANCICLTSRWRTARRTGSRTGSNRAIRL